MICAKVKKGRVSTLFCIKKPIFGGIFRFNFMQSNRCSLLHFFATFGKEKNH